LFTFKTQKFNNFVYILLLHIDILTKWHCIVLECQKSIAAWRLILQK